VPCDNFTCKGEENENHNIGEYCKINVTEIISIKNVTNDLIIQPIIISWNNLHDIYSITPCKIFLLFFILFFFIFYSEHKNKN
jgi:hypothetical protein